MLICPAIGDTDPIRYRSPSPGGQLFGNILSEAMRTIVGGRLRFESSIIAFSAEKFISSADWPRCIDGLQAPQRGRRLRLRWHCPQASFGFPADA